ncbi:MAG TPA: hypothetical protein VLB07_00780 [Woeseiaceae bacterium]|nr:hypothetical protein [Woeseiaceae bacterium]
MKKKSTWCAIFGLAIYSLSGMAVAQDHTRGWENGNIVAVTEVHIKPGMFNAYVNDLNNVWRKFNELQIKDGDVVSFGMFSNTSAREGEPDLYLTITYKNWAAFDRGVEYFEELGARLLGSSENVRMAGVDREQLRTIGSTYVLQEVKFKD